MPKLSIVLDINQHGDQTFRIDGDPALWPLVGRLAAAASPIQQTTATVVINNMSGENTQARRSPAERLSWGRHNGAGVSLTLDGNTVLIAGELAEKLAEALSPRQIAKMLDPAADRLDQRRPATPARASPRSERLPAPHHPGSLPPSITSNFGDGEET